MKYFTIILLFMFSCSQVQRVGEDESNHKPPIEKYQKPVVVEKVRVDTVYVDVATKTPYMVTADGKVVPQEGVHYKAVKANYDDTETVVKLVHLVYNNKYNIKKVWYTHNVFHNKGSLLGDDQHATIITTVQTVEKKGYGTFKRHYIKVVDAYGNDIHTVSDEVKEVGKQKFEELLKILINS